MSRNDGDDQTGTATTSEQENYAEDKKCRICGFADMQNVNIFSTSNCKALVNKILTVYPIVLYKNDPLPKSICKKCICNVTIMYNDILRVTKMQSKWIQNVRTVQPQHKYIRVLDMIEQSNTMARQSIKTTLGDEVEAKLSVGHRLLLNELPQKHIKSKAHVEPRPAAAATTTAAEPATTTTMSSFSMDYDDGVVHKVPPVRITTTSTTTTTTLAAAAPPPPCTPTKPKIGPKFKSNNSNCNEIKDIKSQLALNGCTLLQLGAQNTVDDVPTIKQETVDAEDNIDDIIAAADEVVDNYWLSPVPGPPPPLTIKCRLCPQQFKSLVSLATHQITHMRLVMPQIFQRQFLDKRLRRGRLITIEQRKCIRCLNCWRIFVDNKSILEHWATGECEFYCHICGKQFSQEPKMLREHVPAAHGISYKSAKYGRARLSALAQQTPQQTTPSVEDTVDFSLYPSGMEQELLMEYEEPLVVKSVNVKSNVPPKRAPAKSTKKSSQAKKNSASSAAGITPNEDGSVACRICHKVFQNIKARNSHMRKHKPAYAYGDMVLPPLHGVDPYVTDDVMVDAPAPLPPPPALPRAETVDNTSVTTASMNCFETPAATSTPLRGVRTKFVVRRKELNGGGEVVNMLRIKPLKDLQRKSLIGDATNNWASPAVVAQTPAATTAALANDATGTVIKIEPMEFEQQQQPQQQQQQKQPPQQQQQKQPPQQHKSQQQLHPQVQQQKQPEQQQQQHQEQPIFICVSCNGQFRSNLELFRHKRKCVKYLFNCSQCSQSFRSNDDYKMHVAAQHIELWALNS